MTSEELQYLEGKYVLLICPSNIREGVIYHMAFRVTEVTGFVYGDFLAGDFELSHHRVKVTTISDYQVYTLKELPLLLGYTFCSNLLTDLIKEGADVSLAA